ncbi:MAG TPA: NUDIX domain-containing protein [Actinomycetota bacterium]|jgi:8-oxo-dGTP pyrophosphatase MutT (NUDIX family)|nr:NUDIX domain-containing protein [Actinomycetota bacterium]
MAFEGSYLWRIRQKLGSELVLMPGATVLVENQQGEVLLVRRTDTSEWCVPAGAAEVGDSFAKTAINELKEEAGLTVEERDLVPFGCLSDPGIHTVKYPNGDITHCFAMCFAVRSWSGVPAPDLEEMSDLAFFNPAELPIPMYRPAVKVCEMYEMFKSNGQFQVS